MHAHQAMGSRPPRPSRMVLSQILPTFCQCFTREANALCAVTTKANAIGYAKHRSRSHRAVIRVYDEAGNVIDRHEHAGEVQGVVSALVPTVLLDSVSQMPNNSAQSRDRACRSLRPRPGRTSGQSHRLQWGHCSRCRHRPRPHRDWSTSRRWVNPNQFRQDGKHGDPPRRALSANGTSLG